MRVAQAIALAWITSCAGPAPASRPIAGFSESGRLVLRGDESLRRGDYEDAEATYREAVDTAVLEPDSSNLTIALVQLAELERLRGRLAAGRAWLTDAEARASDKDILGWSRYLLVRGRIEAEEGRTDRANASFALHYQFCLDHSLPDRALGSAHQLALSGPLSQRVAWTERGVALAEGLSDPSWLAVLWNNLGWAYDDAGQHEDALESFLSAHQNHELVGSPAERVAATWAVGRSYRLLANFEDAREWLSSSLTRAESFHGLEGSAESAQWLALSLWELAELAADEGSPREAFARMRDAHRTMTEAEIGNWWPDGLERLEQRLAELSPIAGA